MNKRLKLETIVPRELYIKRKADIQLKQIIDDMSRPASILVSRQMGKTNLLLNTKREFEDSKTIFVYIDLSKIDNNIRDCFRYIIDTAIDTNLDVFEKIENDIDKIREKNRLPYREHEQELLTLLKCFDGKIIIILDEIDSMKKFDFSDQFFSQIRSAYFSSRTNFNEFYNLTYILSGVLEPSEIIKDKDKSPFNISEKVYLNDFTKKEFESFIEKINFDFFNDNITNRIYDWTGGHPRMIWNICSMLEKIYIEKNKIDIDDVDKVIDLLYLSQSDTPPIDHIKDLLNDNHDITNILLSIKQDRSSFNITGLDKNKLYLYGITDVVKDNKVKIKNKVIDTVLSEDYLKSILYTSKTSFQIALDYYQNNDYQLSLNEFLKCIESEEITKEEKKYSHYYIGICQYQLGHYQLALNSFDNANFNKETEGKMFYQKELDKGICFLWLTQYEDALKQYDLALKSKDRSIQINAYINKATVYIYDESRQNEDDVINNLDSAISILIENENDLEKRYYAETIAKAYFNKASFFTRINKRKEAIKLYKQILTINDVAKYKPNVLIELIKLDDENKKSYLDNIYEVIKTNSLKFEINNDVIDYSVNTLSEYIYYLITSKEYELLKTVLNYSQNTYDIFKSKCNVLVVCADYFYKDKNKSEQFYLHSLKYQNEEIGSQLCYRDVYTNLVYIYYQNNNYKLLKQYAEQTIKLLVETQDEYELNYNYYSIISIIFDELIRHSDLTLAQKLFNEIESEIIDKISKENLIFKAILLDKKHTLCANTEDKKDISKKCVSILNENGKNLTNFNASTINYTNSIKKKHNNFLLLNTNRVPYVNSKKVGRNDPCECGSGKKFKKCCGENKK